MPSVASADTASDLAGSNTAYYGAIFIRDCLVSLRQAKEADGGGGKVMSQDRVDAYTFLAPIVGGDLPVVPIGRTFKGDNGVAHCNDVALVKTAMAAIGYTNPGNFLTDIGYHTEQRQGVFVGQTCTKDLYPVCTNNYATVTVYVIAGDDTFNTTIMSKHPQSLQAKYVAYLSVFNAYCGLTEPPTGSGDAVTYKKVVKDAKGTYSAVPTDAEFAVTTTTQSDGGGSSASGSTSTVKVHVANISIDNFDYRGQNTNCKDLLTKLDGLVGAVVTYNNAHTGDPIKTDISATPTNNGSVDCAANPTDASCTSGKSSCTVDGIGWIVCPVMTFLAGINDVLYSFLANALKVDPQIFGSDASTGLYGAWNTFRSYANILFILAFLVIVYSQITSVGITNYGIKKLLPKLIVAAILVNTSFYICQLAVDISNILGYGLKSLFTAIGGGVATAGTGLSWVSVIGGGLAAVGAGAGVVALILAISVPVVLAGVLALLSIAVILIVRQSIILLLIAISPLAFVAWLLPNTEKWFKKWWDLFFAMLVLFPIISALFGAGALAGSILATGKFGDDAGAAKLAALGAMVLPLILTIPLLQNSLKATGALGAKLSGWSNKANSRIGSKVKGESKLGRGWSQAMSYRSGRRANKQTEAIATKRAYRGLAGVAGGAGYAGTLENRAKEAADKEHAEAVTRATSGFTGMKDDDILDIAKDTKRSAAERQAAISHLMQKGKHDHKVAAMAASGTLGDDENGKRARAAVSDEYARSDLSTLYGKEIAGSVRTGSSGGGEVDMTAALRGNFGNVSAQTLANKNYATAVAAAYGGAAPEQQAKIDKAIDKIHSTPQIAAAITDDIETELLNIPHYAVSQANAAAAATPTAPAAAPTTTAPAAAPTATAPTAFGAAAAALPHSNTLVPPPTAPASPTPTSAASPPAAAPASNTPPSTAPDDDDDMYGVTPI